MGMNKIKENELNVKNQMREKKEKNNASIIFQPSIPKLVGSYDPMLTRDFNNLT